MGENTENHFYPTLVELSSTGKRIAAHQVMGGRKVGVKSLLLVKVKVKVHFIVRPTSYVED